MSTCSRVLCTIILLQACSIVRISSFPHHATNDDMEIITVEEVAHSPDEAKTPTAPLITRNNRGYGSDPDSDSDSDSGSFAISSAQQNEASREPTIDIADDLIFLADRAQHNADEQSPQTTTAAAAAAVQPGPVGTSQQIDLLTSVEEHSLKAALDATLAQPKSSEEQRNVAKLKSTKNSVDSGAVVAASADGGAPVGSVAATTPQNELRMGHVNSDNAGNNNDDAIGRDDKITETNDDGDGIGDGVEVDADVDVDSEELDIAPSVQQPVTPIDMSDFVALIPAAKVKSIAANYYLNDPEVQRAYAYLNSRDFAVLRQYVIELPEVKAFLKYLNNNGLNVVGFLNTLTNLTCKPDELFPTDESTADIGSGSDAISGNEIDNELRFFQSVTTTFPAQSEAKTTTERQLNGTHGLVETILETLPQDQILATFFDKLESNEQFSKLVESISRPAFAKILHNVQNSLQLRVLIFQLHNNGIPITRILDSIKAYFFLGTF